MKPDHLASSFLKRQDRYEGGPMPILTELWIDRVANRTKYDLQQDGVPVYNYPLVKDWLSDNVSIFREGTPAVSQLNLNSRKLNLSFHFSLQGILEALTSPIYIGIFIRIAISTNLVVVNHDVVSLSRVTHSMVLLLPFV